MTSLEPAAVNSRKSARRRKRRHGKANALNGELAAILASPDARLGPAMQALPSDRHRAFVLALFQVRPGHGSRVRAVKMAGFGTTATTPHGWASLASIYANDDRVQRAIEEEGARRIVGTSPLAIRMLERLVEDPTHKDHARGLAMVIDRVHPVETTHRIDVDHHHHHRIEANEKTLARIQALTLLAGMDPAKLPPIIEGTFTKTLSPPVTAQPREDDHEHPDD